MDQLQKLTLQVAKEIVVKFIEVGRISPSNFAEHFAPIYDEIRGTVIKDKPTPDKDDTVESA
ncbi:MAG: hypothetical protein EOL86_07030 [Deltaproteobacteria bacterium]|nr:hypothetical protein [Deltaproteobacteria bacterium]